METFAFILLVIFIVIGITAVVCTYVKTIGKSSDDDLSFRIELLSDRIRELETEQAITTVLESVENDR
jgi:type II secretory pathway component PulF